MFPSIEDKIKGGVAGILAGGTTGALGHKFASNSIPSYRVALAKSNLSTMVILGAMVEAYFGGYRFWMHFPKAPTPPSITDN